MLKKKDEALLRGFLNLYDLVYDSANAEYDENEEFVVYKNLVHNTYPEFKFNLLISSKDICNLDVNTISKYHPFISLSRTKPLISARNKNPFFISSTFYDPSFIELYSFMHGKAATWDNIDDRFLIKIGDIKNKNVLNNLIDEEKRKIVFQLDSKTNYGKIEQLINKMYAPDKNTTGKLIKPYLEADRVGLFSKLKSPVIKILKQIYLEGIGNDENYSLTKSIIHNLNENYTFGLNSFIYESLIDDNIHFSFTQSCKNMYNFIYNLESLKFSEQHYEQLSCSIHIMITYGRNSKKAILTQYLEFFKYIGLIQDSIDGEMFFILANPTDFINKLSVFFDVIRHGINRFKNDFKYLKPLLNDSLLSDTDLENINKLVLIFKNQANRIDPDLLYIDKHLREFCFPLLIFSIFLGFCSEREYLIVPCEIEGEFQDRMKILTTPEAQMGGTISSNIQKDLDIIYEMVKIDGCKTIRKRGFEVDYIEIISIKQKHELLLEYGNYLKETLKRIKETLTAYLSDLNSSKFSSVFLINSLEGFLDELNTIKPRFASKNTLNPALIRLTEIEEQSERMYQTWNEINKSYDEVYNKITQFIAQEVGNQIKRFSGCTEFNSDFNQLKDRFDNLKNTLDQTIEKLRSISGYNLDSYKEELERIDKEFETNCENFENLIEEVNNFFERKKKELELKQLVLKRANKFSVNNIRDDEILINKFLEISDKVCGEFLTTFNEKVNRIKVEGDYITGNCWNAYYELMSKNEIEKIQDFTKKLQIKPVLIESINQADLKTLGDLNLIQMDQIIIYQI